MTAKKDSRNRGFEEKAHLNVDQNAYEEGYERIFGKKENSVDQRLADDKDLSISDWSNIAIEIQMEFNQYKEQAREDILALVMMIDQGIIPPALYAQIKDKYL